MKTRNIYSALCTTFVAGLVLVACNDYDAAQTAYEEIVDSDVTITPPNMDSAWELQLIPNVGQHSGEVFVYKDKKYDKLFTRTLGWNGGIGVQSTLLSDGNVFWAFNDSYYGVVDAETRARGNCNFPHNSIMVQTTVSGSLGETDDDLRWLVDYVQTNDPDGEGYYQAYAHIAPDETIMGETDEEYFYQIGGATVFDNNGVEELQMLWGKYNEEKMTRTGTCLAVYSLEGQPGNSTYLKIISKNEEFNIDDVGYGSTMWKDEDGHIYLYVTENNRPLVARTTTHDLASEWEYYIRDLNGNFIWQKMYPTKEERTRSTIMENNYVCSMPQIFRKGDYYYMVGQAKSYGHSVYLYRLSLIHISEPTRH